MAKPRLTISVDPDLYEVLKEKVKASKKAGEKVSLADLFNEAGNIVYAEKVADYRKRKLQRVAA